MNFCSLCKNKIFILVQINVAMNLPNVLYIFILPEDGQVCRNDVVNKAVDSKF
jgi:hypothetical protein